MRGGLRQMFDALICLAVTVILVRTFQVEGYMISTGSMAPTLPGFHKRVICPACRFEFPVGDAHPHDDFGQPEEQTGSHVSAADSPHPPENSLSASSTGMTAVCPNCGLHSIDISKIPRNQGDQLLVHKNAYDYLSPHRWEVIVFRNPRRPTQAYVKRIVGLPGETIRIRDGNVWVNDEIQRKSFQQQRAMRILVYDHNFEPRNDSNWQPRWFVETGNPDWKRAGQAFESAISVHSRGKESRPFSWVTYRHWIRAGGTHQTEVKVPQSLQRHDLATPSLYPLKYDDKTKTLSHTGVLPDRARDRIAAVIDDPAFRQFMSEFAEKTHLAPVTDDYGYNRVHRSYRPVPVRDLMLAATLSLRGGHGQFAMELTDGQQRFRFILDAATRDVSLIAVDEHKVLRRARLKAEVLNEPLQVEMSLFDRQVLVAVNGQTIFKPWFLDAVSSKEDFSHMPARIGVRELQVRVSSIKLYRDVHYTQKGKTKSFTLKDDEFFMLGDNSPISADSRVWEGGGVHRRLFLGKPILVHLPSRPGKFQIGGFNIHIRIPDLSRIRYIR
ncbi:MAG: hypothetical protein Tsb009_04570 [Planctomycetaceae bacterium]